MQIVHMHFVLGRGEAEFVRRAIDEAFFQATTSECVAPVGVYCRSPQHLLVHSHKRSTHES
jgi:hypothetical protein